MVALPHLLVRTVHVLGMALLLGGAAVTWGSLRWVVPPTDAEATTHEATTPEATTPERTGDARSDESQTDEPRTDEPPVDEAPIDGTSAGETLTDETPTDAPSTRSAPGTGSATVLTMGYEWLFWTALGAMVVTGVGNLGALAPAIPGPGTTWGATLTVKLFAVLGLLVGSALRTLVALRSTADARWLSPWYGATAAYLVGLLVLAEVLTHG